MVPPLRRQQRERGAVDDGGMERDAPAAEHYTCLVRRAVIAAGDRSAEPVPSSSPSSFRSPMVVARNCSKMSRQASPSGDSDST